MPEADAVRRHSNLTWEEFSSPNAIQFAEVGGYTMAYTLIEKELYDRWIGAVLAEVASLG